ncbi:ribonuclease H2, subunit C [Leucosporidium creatinivorum]|uniref:Ribonuclease H2, subunit C n=1 Tax=Leucosporidium creatinivorum TaxID=106004 RepID=A0A1Y2EZS7_9BASI|nr:ribonuclease H2, subunit C [Leucosporidium creatinivorum]
MSTPLAQTTILDSFPSTSSASDASTPPSVESISLLPFFINYDGPAPISTYFHPTPVPSTSAAVAEGETKPLQQQAAFRGRLLVSKRVPLPQGYTGLVFSTSQPVAAAPLAPTTPSKRNAASAPKRVKVDAAAERKAAAERAKGLRRSPRKRVVKEVKKFMLDSDDEEDQENEPVGVKAPKEEQEEEKMVVVEESTTIVVEEETTIPAAAPSAPTPAPKESTPEPQPSIAEPQPQDDDDLPLARDERHLVPVLTFNSIDIWHPDYAGDLADDVYARTMSEWVGVSAKIHAY